MNRMRIYFLSTVPFAGMKEQEVIQPLAMGLTLPTLLAVLMRAGLTHRSDSASSELMVHLFNLNCSNGLATHIMPGSNKVPPPNIVTPTTTPGLQHRKLEPEHLGAGRCEKSCFYNCNLFRNGYYVHPGAGQAVAGDPGGGRCVFCVFKKIFLCVCVLIFKKIILFVCVDFFKYNYFLLQNKCVFWRFLKTVFFCCKTFVCFDFFV